MRLEVTRKSDLAVRALRVLAEGERMKAVDLARAVGTTAGFVTQVLNPMVRARWIRSDPGPAGGYRLVVSLADISVLAVIETVEGPTDTGVCVLVDRECATSGPCALHGAWVRARAHLLSELDATSVAEAPMPDEASR